MGKVGKNDGLAYLSASMCAATVNYPLWKASAINQSGFVVNATGSNSYFRSQRLNLFISAISPPYRGVPAVILGMTWARAAIFYGSDYYRGILEKKNMPQMLSMALPPLVLSSVVQCINMPIVRASVTMQNPKNYSDPNFRTTFSSVRYLAETKGFFKLWHGLSAGLAKSVPKYITSVVVKDYCEEMLPKATNDSEFVARAAVKSVIAGIAGAVLTNPMDVIRNEMFKTDKNMFQTIANLGNGERQLGNRSIAWMYRGLGSNLIAVSVPITLTIFLTDMFIKLDFMRLPSAPSTEKTLKH